MQNTIAVPRVCVESPPCSVCGTRQGSKRQNGQHVRYLGERFGLPGVLCATCRAREVRREAALAQGLQPGRRGRRPSTASPIAVPILARSREKRQEEWPSPEQLAESVRVIREEGEQAGRRPHAGDTPAEIKRRRWADLAALERKQVLASRRQAMQRPTG